MDNAPQDQPVEHVTYESSRAGYPPRTLTPAEPGYGVDLEMLWTDMKYVLWAEVCLSPIH